MKTRKIGELEVSVVGLGCNNFGGRLDASQTESVVGAAIEAGITLFDTADIYGNTLSEDHLGRALKGRRDNVVLATKFGMSSGESVEGGASAPYVKKALEASLSRLGTDRIDLYQIHFPIAGTPITETLGALREAVDEGKVREIGCSNFSAEQMREARSGEGRMFASVQNHYNLLARDAESEVLPECDRLNMAFLPYFPLANGLLTGKYTEGNPAPKGTRIEGMGAERSAELLSGDSMAQVTALASLAADHGHTLLELAIGWLLSRAPVASVISGATSAPQVAANAAAGTWIPDESALAQIDAICPA